MKRCSSCRKVAPVFKEFKHEHDCTNRYARRRKPTIWCETCWTSYIKWEQEKKERGA